jgi:hypothetical protein
MSRPGGAVTPGGSSDAPAAASASRAASTPRPITFGAGTVRGTATLNETALPRATDDPGAGSWATTVPAVASLGTSTTGSATVKPSFASARLARSSGRPRTSGTATIGATATCSVTMVPTGTRVPGGGSVAMTVPGAAMSVGTNCGSARPRPARAIAWAASSARAPITNGTGIRGTAVTTSATGVASATVVPATGLWAITRSGGSSSVSRSVIVPACIPAATSSRRASSSGCPVTSGTVRPVSPTRVSRSRWENRRAVVRSTSTVSRANSQPVPRLAVAGPPNTPISASPAGPSPGPSATSTSTA